MDDSSGTTTGNTDTSGTGVIGTVDTVFTPTDDDRVVGGVGTVTTGNGVGVGDATPWRTAAVGYGIWRRLCYSGSSKVAPVSNITLDNLVVNEKSLGKLVKEAFEENKGKSYNDIVNAAKSKVAPSLATAEWVARPDVQDFVQNDAVDILANIMVIEDRFPWYLDDLRTDVIDPFRLSIDALCDKVEELKDKYESFDLEDDAKTRLAIIITQLSSICCAAEKLEILQAEIEKRKARVLQSIQLSNFVSKHPVLDIEQAFQKVVLLLWPI